MDIATLLEYAVAQNASDIHLRVNKEPWLRIDGKLFVPDNFGVVTQVDLETFLRVALPGIEIQPDSDFLICGNAVKGNRFRGNFFHSAGKVGLVLRALPAQIPQLDTLGLPPKLTELLDRESGLILVTGATGSGKSTTLASMVQQICCAPHQHVITIEDPVEFQLSNDNNLITQRALGADVKSFPIALKSAMREDPDIIMVGETRDRETAELLLTAAETGHMVFSTLHTPSAAGTINRLVSLFPSDAHEGVRAQIADSLIGVLSQTLLPRQGGGRVLAYEFLVVNDPVKNLIRQGKIEQIATPMQTGRKEGMVTMDHCLRGLRDAGTISDATFHATLAKFGQTQSVAR